MPYWSARLARSEVSASGEPGLPPDWPVWNPLRLDTSICEPCLETLPRSRMMLICLGDPEDDGV